MARVKRAVNAQKKRRTAAGDRERLPRSALPAVPQGQGAGAALDAVRLPRPSRPQGRLPPAVDHADQRGRPGQRHDLQPADPGPAAGRHRGRPQDPGRPGRQRRRRLRGDRRGRPGPPSRPRAPVARRPRPPDPHAPDRGVSRAGTAPGGASTVPGTGPCSPRVPPGSSPPAACSAAGTATTPAGSWPRARRRSARRSPAGRGHRAVRHAGRARPARRAGRHGRPRRRAGLRGDRRRASPRWPRPSPRRALVAVCRQLDVAAGAGPGASGRAWWRCSPRSATRATPARCCAPPTRPAPVR